MGLGTLAAARGATQEAWEQFQAALELANALAYHHVALEIVTHLAEVLLAVGRPVEVPALLTLALLYPASRSATTLRAQHLLARCEELLPADVFAKEVTRGYSAKLDSVVEQQAPEDIAALLTYLFTTVLDGRNAYLADGVERALGRKGRDFSDYVRNAAATGIWGR